MAEHDSSGELVHGDVECNGRVVLYIIKGLNPQAHV